MASQDQKSASDQPADTAKDQGATQKGAAEGGEKQPDQGAEHGRSGPKVLPTHYRGMPKNWEKNRESKPSCYVPTWGRSIVSAHLVDSLAEIC